MQQQQQNLKQKLYIYKKIIKTHKNNKNTL